MQFATISSGFFSPADHLDDFAVLVEVKSLERGVPSKFGPKDTITADFTFFASEADLDAGDGMEEAGLQLQQSILVRNLAPIVGKATVVKVGKRPSSQGNNDAWVFEKVSPSVMKKVGAYVERRDAALKADMDDAPGFD